MEDFPMRIAIPVANGKLAAHFGHCEKFALIDVDRQQRLLLDTEIVDAPPHQPGLLPVWLADRGTKVVIAGGMGQRAQMLFAQKGINVLVGAPSDTPERIVSAYLDGSLKMGENICDH
jgi:predicted Fe-Mo cluster-binding NifX family protein